MSKVKEKKKKEPWVRRRHRIFMELLRYPMKLFCRLKYGYTFEKYDDRSRPYLVLYNHQTAFDQFFVGLGFSASLYYVASEDIFSIGRLASLIRYLVNPIPIKKGTSDMRAVLTCRRVALEGGSIALAPEGNRTYSGTTEDIRPSVAGLVKLLRLPVAFFVLRGGYGVHPRWADNIRSGHIHGSVTRVLEYDDYRDMSDDELYSLICRELWVDERENKEENRDRHGAEGLERVLYHCPSCADFAEFSTEGDRIVCRRCGLNVRYGADRRFHDAPDGFPYDSVKDWYDGQKRAVTATDFASYGESPIFEDSVRFSLVNEYKNKEALCERGSLRLYCDRLTVEDGDSAYSFELSEVRALSCIGRNKCNIFSGNRIYQIKGGRTFNALKYVNVFYHIKNMTKEGADYNADGNEFLGL